MIETLSCSSPSWRNSGRRGDSKRNFDDALVERLAETICGIANLGPQSNGFVHIGVADKEADADRIKTLDKVAPLQIGGHWVVGIDRESTIRGCTLDEYVKLLAQKLRNTNLSEGLKTDVLSKFDPISYKGMTVLRIEVPPQKQVSYVGEKCFTREGSETKEVFGPSLEAIFKRFST